MLTQPFSATAPQWKQAAGLLLQRSLPFSQQAHRRRQASWEKWVDKHAVAGASAAHKPSKPPPRERPSQLVEGNVLNRAQPAIEQHTQRSDIWQVLFGSTGHKNTVCGKIRWPDIAGSEWGTPSVGILRKIARTFKSRRELIGMLSRHVVSQNLTM